MFGRKNTQISAETLLPASQIAESMIRYEIISDSVVRMGFNGVTINELNSAQFAVAVKLYQAAVKRNLVIAENEEELSYLYY